MRRPIARTFRFLLLGGILTCGETTEPPPPPPPPPPPLPQLDPGFLRVVLNTPNQNDGGVLFSLTGSSIDSVQQDQGLSLFSGETGNTVRVLVAGDVVAGTIARFWSPDRGLTYSAVVEQVAARVTYAQQSLTGYSLVIQR